MLDANFHRLHDGDKHWLELHSLDQELVPGCITVQHFDSTRSSRPLSGEPAQHFFVQDEATITFKVRSPDAAIRGAKALNAVFSGTGTRFVAEAVPDKEGGEVYHIVSNMDKRHWEKLCVYCNYRFDREISNPEQKASLSKECDARIKAYTKGTSASEWHNVEGVPAFVTLMGLHGNLRPKEKHPADARRKALELNSPHPRGTPRVFEGVIMHANMDKTGEIYVTFDPNRYARDLATNGKPYYQLLMETFGGNPLDGELAPSRRAIQTIGLGLGLFGLTKVGEELIGVVGPMVSAGTAAGFMLVTYADHRWKVLDRLSAIRKLRSEKNLMQKIEQSGQVIVLEDRDVAPEIRRAYAKDIINDRAPLDDGLDGSHTNLAIRALIESRDGNGNGAKVASRIEDLLNRKLSGGVMSLKR